MASGGDDNSALLSLDPVVQEARKRFDRCSEWESVWRQKFIEDIKFANGDSQNGFQWPNEIRNLRERSSRPCLTMNLIKPHNRMITNEARKNKSSVRYIGMGNGATQEMANIYQDLHRHIEYISEAQSAYSVARNFQVDGGLGYWRIVTDYTDPESFDVEPMIVPVNDPLMIYMDPDSQRIDRLDAKFAFAFDDIDKDEFDETYPEIVDMIGHQPLGMGTSSNDWVTKNKIRVVEYFRKVPEKKRIMSFAHLGERFTISHDKLEKLVLDREARDRIVNDPATRHKTVWATKIEWFLIAGEKIIDQTDWPGRYIPIIPCVGDEISIDGHIDRKGNTRAMLDAQRMFNYNNSAQVEFGALQVKTPWIAPAKAIEEFEAVWRTANQDNPSILPFNHTDPEHPDIPLPPPQRIEPPSISPAFQLGAESARQHMMMVTGQYENSLGEQGNERTGAAINARRHQGATATYHFQDNYETALIATGKQLIDLFPKIYDTKRVKRIISDDGIEYDLEINPALRAGYLEQQSRDGKIIRKCLNPLVGQFDVAATVGPSYDSKRQETADSLALILTQAPNVIPYVADLLLKNLPFEGAQEAALRMRRMIPPQALGDGPTQNEQMLQQQIQGLRAELVKLLDKNAKDQLKLVGKDQLRDIEAYKAETDRFKALQDSLPMDPAGLQAVVEQLVNESLNTSVASVTEENKADGDGEGTARAPAPAEEPPVPGAQKAPDGHWYIRDPVSKGYMHVQEKPPWPEARRAPDGHFYVPDGKGGWLRAVKKAEGASPASAQGG